MAVQKSWPDGTKLTSDSDLETPKTYNRHGLVSRSGDYFYCVAVYEQKYDIEIFISMKENPFQVKNIIYSAKLIFTLNNEDLNYRYWTKKNTQRMRKYYT